MSDHQFKSFRDGIPALAAIFTAFALIRLDRLVQACIFIFVLHGFKAVEPLILCTAFFLVVKNLKHQQAVVFTWIFAVGSLIWLDRGGKILPSLPSWLWQGALSRWNVVFKMSVLRMISFSLDFHEPNVKVKDCNACLNQICGKCRSNQRAGDFTFKSYFTFVFYPPLYLSGPIMTFNDFWQQSRAESIKYKSTFIYGLRLLASWLCLEVILHLFHVCAIKSANAWNDSFTPLSYAGIAFLNLKIIWLKLVVIWRFARFFALLDGIDPPENMHRCMSNNYSALMFWRSWHRSFNQWIVRYLYVPLGGNKTTPYNLFPVFAFVALWHDVNWQLAAWGCLIPLFILPEIIARTLSKRLALQKWRNYRQLAAIGASLNIFLMMLANLVGFSVGIEGAKLMLKQMLGKGGIVFLLSTLLVFYSAAQIMFEIREIEFRKHGKYLSY